MATGLNNLNIPFGLDKARGTLNCRGGFTKAQLAQFEFPVPIPKSEYNDSALAARREQSITIVNFLGSNNVQALNTADCNEDGEDDEMWNEQSNITRFASQNGMAEELNVPPFGHTVSCNQYAVDGKLTVIPSTANSQELDDLRNKNIVIKENRITGAVTWTTNTIPNKDNKFYAFNQLQRDCSLDVSKPPHMSYPDQKNQDHENSGNVTGSVRRAPLPVLVYSELIKAGGELEIPAMTEVYRVHSLETERQANLKLKNIHGMVSDMPNKQSFVQLASALCTVGDVVFFTKSNSPSETVDITCIPFINCYQIPDISVYSN